MRSASCFAAILLMLASGHRSLAQQQSQERRRPNVIVILADDLGWRDLGYAGSTFYETPNIDALAARGCRFDSAYSACTVCSPSRAALLTGRYPARVGVTDYIGGPQPQEAATRPIYRDRLLPAPYREHLAPEETTLAETFREVGYATMCAGKWHLGGKGFPPENQGFDIARDFATPRRRPSQHVPAADGDEYPGLRLARASAEWIAQQSSAKKPFFLCFASHDPHIPLRPPQPTIEHFEAKRETLKLTDEFAPEGQSRVRLTQSHAVYAATIKMLDDAVGIIIKQLEDQMLLDDTIILFTSDNGGLAANEGSPTSNAPLRAGKGWAYEGGIRVPLIAVVPGLTRAGASTSERAISTDLFPTLLAACELPPRPADHIDGVSLLPALRGEELAERDLFWHYPHYGNQGGAPYSALRSGNMKLIVFHDPHQGTELYDLATDPSEKNNLARLQPQDVDALREKLDAWKASVKAVDARPATPAP